MKNVKFNGKLIVLFFITGYLPMLLVTILLSRTARGYLGNTSEKDNLAYGRVVADKVDEFFDQCEQDGLVLSMTGNLITAISNYRTTNGAEKETINADVVSLLSTVKDQYGYMDVFLSDSEGVILFSSQGDANKSAPDPHMAAPIKSALSGKPAWSEYFNMGGMMNLMAYSVPVYKNDKIIGTVNLTITQSMIDPMIQEAASFLGEETDVYLVNSEGLLLTNTMQGDFTEGAALTQTLSVKAVELLTPEIQSNNMEFHGYADYTSYHGDEVYGTFSVVRFGGQSCGLVMEIPASEVVGIQKSMMFNSVIFNIVVVATAFVILILFARTITVPIGKIVVNLKRIEEYDISQNIPEKLTKRKDEIGKLATALQNLQEHLRELMSSILSNSETLAASSEQLTATAEQSAIASNEVATTVTEIANGATNQAQNTQEGSIHIGALGALIDKNDVCINDLNSATTSVEDLVKEGLQIIDRLSEITVENSEHSSQVEKSILKTQESTNRISEASALIASIAEQTNLLSLNASIEAARAGEAGRGFAVVADEIGKLAEQSAASTQNIDAIIRDLKLDSESTVHEMRESKEIIVVQSDIVQQTGDKYRQISNAMNTAAHAVETISRSSVTMNEKKAQVEDVMESLSALAQENAAATEEVSASIEEQSASVQEISGASENLSQLAMELKDLISQFKL